MIHRAETLNDLARSTGLGLHPLKGEWLGFGALKVNRNWRVVFRFDETLRQASDLDYLDYH
jgi:proteic killer suppression protein